MKNKLIKTLGVGALCCIGALSLTGCSNVEINQNQIDRLTEISESMSDYLQNEKAKSLLKKADAYLLSNRENLMKNCKITQTNEAGNDRNLIYYQTSDETKVFCLHTNVTYQEKNSDKAYNCDINDSGDKLVVESKKEINSFDEQVSEMDYFYTSLFKKCNFEIGDYAYHKVNEKGNYEITVLTTANLGSATTSTVCYTIEITADGILVNISMKMISSTGVIVNNEKIEFGTVVESDVADLLTAAKSASLTI